MPRKVNDTITTIVCSHESDLDGIFSASIATIKFPEADISFYNYGRSNFEKMFEHIMLNVKKEESTGKIIISDLGINPDVKDLSISAIREFNQLGWEVIWVDHHPWSKEVKSSIAPLATVIHDESGQRCASELMLEYIRIDSKVAKQSIHPGSRHGFHDRRCIHCAHFRVNPVLSEYSTFREKS